MNGPTSYPFLCGLLLDRVQVPVNVGGRTGSASGAFDRVGFAGRQRLLRSTDGHPRWPHCQSNNKFSMKCRQVHEYIKQNILTQRNRMKMTICDIFNLNLNFACLRKSKCERKCLKDAIQTTAKVYSFPISQHPFS